MARLQQRCEQGETFSYLYFWGHTEPKSGPVTKACLSQWYPAGFTVAGIGYQNTEQYMMAKKAELFGDEACLAQHGGHHG